MKRLLPLACLLSLTLCAVPAAAERPNRQAFKHFKVGAERYKAGEYEAAITAFEEGYAIQDHPMFQVNIALAHWRLGQAQQALAAADLAALRPEDLGPEIAAQNAARRSVFSVITVGSERAVAMEEQARDAAAIAAAQAEADRLAALERTVEPEPRALFTALGWTGVAVAGAGGLSLIGWSVAETGMSDEVRRLENAGEAGDRAEYDAAQEEVRKKQTTARILLGTGAILTVAGTGLIVFDLMRDRESSVAVGFDADGSPVFTWRARF